MPRVQVEDLNNGQVLQPVQQLGDTYAGYDKPVIDQNLERLSAALGHFGDTLGTLAGRLNKTGLTDPRKAEVEKYISTTSEEQRIKDVNEGRAMYWDVPNLREIQTSRLGQEATNRLLGPIKAGIADGSIPVVDGNGVFIDPSGAIQQAAASHFSGLGPLGKDPSYTKAVSDGLFGQKTAIDDLARQKRAEFNVKLAEGTAQAIYNNVITNAANPKVTDEELAKLYNGVKSATNSQLGMTYQKQDELLVGQLKTALEQNPNSAEAVDRILKLDRGGGADGKAVYKRLMDNPSLFKDVQYLQSQVNEVRKGNFDREQKAQAVDAAIKAANAGDGTFQSIQDHAYTNPYDLKDPNRVLKAGEIRDQALARSNADDEARFARQNLAPEAANRERFEAQANRYIGSNVANPGWSKPLDYVSTVIANPAQATQPDNMKKLLAAQDIYEELNARNPGYVKNTLKVDDRSEQLFSAARIYRDLKGDPPEVAMSKAVSTISRPETDLTKEAQTRIKNSVGSVGADWWQFFGSGTGYNKLQVQKDITSLALAMGRDTSLDPDEVVKSAAKIVSERATVVNGQTIIGNPYVTKDNRTAWQQRLEEVFVANPHIAGQDGKITGPAQLSIQPMAGNSGMFRVTDSQGFPVYVPGETSGKWRPLTIDGREIRAIQGVQTANEQDRAASNQQINAANAEINSRLQPNPIPSFDGSMSIDLTPDTSAATAASKEKLRTAQERKASIDRSNMSPTEKQRQERRKASELLPLDFNTPQ